MAPRKRISKIPTRVVAPEVVASDGASRSIGIQTDVQAPVLVAPRPTKRQKILEKIKMLSKANPLQGLPSAASSSSQNRADPYPNGFVPTAREKACQVDEKELLNGSGTEPQRPQSEFGQKMDQLKNMMDRRRIESINWDRNRLVDLHIMINKDPPPRWAVACDMWLEVDQLEGRILAFEEEEEHIKGALARNQT